MGKKSAPPAPDYTALANQQADASKSTAQYNNGTNRVDQITPDGSITWSIKPGADPKNPQPGDYVQTTAYSPQQQALASGLGNIQQSYVNTAQNSLGRVGEAMATPFDTSKLPAMQTMGGQSTNAVAGGAQGAPGTAGLPALGGDYEASRKAVSDAMMSRISPQLDRNDEATRTRLLNSGIEQGSAGWNTEMQNLSQARTDAQMQATLAGSAEQSRLAGLASSDRAQLYGEGVTGANLNNSANQQNFQQNFNLDQITNAYQQSQAQFNNSARQQGISEQAYLRQLPLSEMNALLSGTQPVAPQGQSYYTGASAQTPQLLDAGIAQNQASQAAATQQQSGFNALLSGLGGLGSAGIMKFSDRRLKTDLRQIGTHRATGLPLYLWNWIDGSGSDYGVIAQDLQRIIPEAVVTDDPSGYLKVDYSKIGGQL